MGNVGLEEYSVDKENVLSWAEINLGALDIVKVSYFVSVAVLAR